MTDCIGGKSLHIENYDQQSAGSGCELFFFCLIEPKENTEMCLQPKQKMCIP